MSMARGDEMAAKGGGDYGRATGDNSGIAVLMFDAKYPPPVVGGKEKQAHLLASQLVRDGVEVSAFSLDHVGCKSGLIDGVYVRRFQASYLGYAHLLVAVFSARVRHSVLHVHTPSTIGILVATVGYLSGYKVFFKLPNVGLVSEATGLRGRIITSLAKRIAATVTLEEESAVHLETAGVPGSKIMHADNGVRVSSRPFVFNHKQDRFEFLYASRLLSHKRCDDLLRAFSSADFGHEFATVRILGDGPELSRLQSLAAELGCASRVEFEGYVSHVENFMENAGCLVVCSEREGMPNVILEAMSMQLPIIATNVGGIRTLVGELGTRYLYRPADVDHLTQLMSSIVCQPSETEAYAKALYERCINQFEIGVVARSYRIRYEASLNT